MWENPFDCDLPLALIFEEILDFDGKKKQKETDEKEEEATS